MDARSLVPVGLIALGLGVASARGTEADTILIAPGEYAPLLRSRDEPEMRAVPAFRVDRHPVTNADFLAFVQTHPRWRRSRVSALFADQQYLSHWEADLALGAETDPDAPVVQVSWFAARAYAVARQGRLPTIAQWERMAAVGISQGAAREDPVVDQLMTTWFSRPTEDRLPAVMSGSANQLGVHDLFGLVWEWVEDFNEALVTGESRGDPGLERNLFCGAGSVGARDKTDYAGFMRAGFRSSLHASYCVPNLGFRCVYAP